MMDEYSAKIAYSSRELTPRERVALKDIKNAIGLDQATKDGGEVTIKYGMYAMVEVHNPQSDKPDYIRCVIMDKEGNKYYTGSKSFITAFLSIEEEMRETGEEFTIVAYRLPSAKYSGKEFITCSLV